MRDLVVYCADIGSVKRGNFGGARLARGVDEPHTDTSIEALIADLAGHLNAGFPVALGFECPLWIPLPQKCEQLGSARTGESGKGMKSRPWSAGGGAAALTTGAVQVPWVLRALKCRVPDRQAFLDWHEFETEGRGLFLWEAFVTAEGKVGTVKAPGDEGKDERDARIAVEEFDSVLDDPKAANACQPKDEVFSLVGAAMLRTCWSTDPALLRQPCLVIKPA